MRVRGGRNSPRPPFVVARLLRIPVGRQLRRGHFHLLIKLGSKRPDTLPDLLLEDAHQAVTLTGLTHPTQREGHREHLHLGERRRIFAFDLGIAYGVPNVCVTPDEEIDERAQKMGLAGAFGLHPKALPFAVYDAIEDAFEVRPQRRGEMIVGHSLARLGSRDSLRQARCCLWLRLDSDDSVEFANVHGLPFLPKDLLDDSGLVKVFEQAVRVACHLLGPDALIEEAIEDQHDHGEVAAEPLVKLPHAGVIPGQEADGLHDEHGTSSGPT